MKEYITACPRNCYSTCSFKVIVEDNKLLKILPDEDNLVTPEGPCIKGLSYLERAGSDERLIFPLLRQEDGSFKQITYSEAILIISEKLRALASAGMQKSVLYYTGSGMSGLSNEIGGNFFNAFGGATTTYGNFCWPAGLEAVRLTLGEVKHNAPWDIENAKLIIAWGKNPAETNIQETVFIDNARKKGAKYVVIDPRKTPSADKADLLIRPKPGTDAALALAIASILIDENRIDKEFIDSHVYGYSEFAKSLSISVAEAEQITGIPKEEIRRFAQLIADNAPVTFIPGYGMQRYSNGGQTTRAILSLAIITGNLGKKGSGFNYSNLQGYVFDRVKEPQSYYPDINKNPIFRRSISMARLGKDLLNISDPEIRFAWIERGNPLTQAPDTNTVIKAFEKIDFTVVVDQFMTDTARIADLILPSKNMFEQQDIVSSYWSPYVYYRPRVLNAPGEIKPEPEIYYDLAKLLNLEFSEMDIPYPGEEALDLWLENRIKGITPLTLEMLRVGKKIAPGYQEIAFSDLLFKTASGKIELKAEDVRTLWGEDPVPVYSEAFRDENMKIHKFLFLSPNNKNRIHSQFGNLDVIKINDLRPKLQIHPSDAKQKGISKGDFVRVFNDRGEINVEADISNNILQGVVSMPNGWWISEGGGGNFLSEGRETDLGHGTAFHDNMVSIEKSSSNERL